MKQQSQQQRNNINIIIINIHIIHINIYLRKSPTLSLPTTRVSAVKTMSFSSPVTPAKVVLVLVPVLMLLLPLLLVLCSRFCWCCFFL